MHQVLVPVTDGAAELTVEPGGTCIFGREALPSRESSAVVVQISRQQGKLQCSPDGGLSLTGKGTGIMKHLRGSAITVMRQGSRVALRLGDRIQLQAVKRA